MPIHSPYASVAETRKVLDAYGLNTKKSFGQHFLINDGIVGKICDTAEIDKSDQVIEIGPGIGTLTYALLKNAASVVAVERDVDMLKILEKTCSDYEKSFTLINKDALKVTPSDLLGVVPNKLVANLPYAVAATLVLDFLQKFESLQSATVMVQSEVADRMCAKLGTKDYGAYTIKLSLYARPTARFNVGPQNFFPPPRVDSAVIRLDRHDLILEDGTPITQEIRHATCIMAEAAFANRRKTILNSCKTYFATKGVEGEKAIALLPEVLSAVGVNARIRGEELSSEDFLNLGQALNKALG